MVKEIEIFIFLNGWHIFLSLSLNLIMKKAYLSVIAVFFSALMFAQEGTGTKIDVDINKDSAAWYASPWVWVVGAAVFILLLVALTRGGGRRAD